LAVAGYAGIIATNNLKDFRSPLAQAKLSVIARLEDADYDGHSLSMLARIASALGQKLEIKMLPKEVA
jgi:hypothetical protein